MAYSGTIWRGVDYSPTWHNWNPGTGNSQTNDSDFANDAFASFWAAAYAPNQYGDSVPINNGKNYRDDIGTISQDHFNLVRLYDWDMSRGTSSTNPVPPTTPTAQDHYNFLNYANTKGLKVVVPVSDYFISNQQYAWGTTSPDATYSFGSAPDSIQQDFKNFIASITDPKTGKIHEAIHSIDIGNEPDIGQGIQEFGTNTSQFLARTIWWIHNLNLQINGQTGKGPDGYDVVGNPTKVMFTATYSDGDQGAGGGSFGWFYDLVNGVTKGQQTPHGAYQSSFPATVVGLKSVDPNYTDHYYNSLNISQIQTAPPYDTSGLTGALSSYDNFQTGQWPYMQFEVPLMFMEVFTPNRQGYTPQTEQVNAAVAQVTAIENYLKTNAGNTWLMGHNYFEFNDEASQSKWTGLYQYTDTSTQVNTGTTSTFFGGFPKMSIPVYTLTPTMNTDGTSSLVDLWTSKFGATEMMASVYDVRASMNNTTIFNLYGTLDRQPDINGYKFWVDANKNGVSLRDISRSFITSSEFTGIYGANVTDEQFINRAYLNILDRSAEAAGIDWWRTQVAQYSDHDLGRAIALLGIVNSPEAVGVMNNNISNNGYFLS